MNKPEKIDYDRLGEDFIAEDGGIKSAFKQIPLPVYVVTRHGRYKKCFSRDTAINRLAHFMTEKVFRRSGIESRLGRGYRETDGVIIFDRGEPSPEYIIAHIRCMRRIRRLLAKKRAIDDWNKKYVKLCVRTAEFMKTRPF
jgi:hypothetical protein